MQDAGCSQNSENLGYCMTYSTLLQYGMAHCTAYCIEFRTTIRMEASKSEIRKKIYPVSIYPGE